MARQYQSHDHVDSSKSTYSQGSGRTNVARESVSARANQNMGRRKSKREKAISPGFVFASLLIAIMIFFFFFIIGIQVGPDLPI